MELAADPGGLECQGWRRFPNTTAYIGIRRDAAGPNGNPIHTGHGGFWVGIQERISIYSLCEGYAQYPDTEKRGVFLGEGRRMTEVATVRRELERVADELCSLVAGKHHDYGESFDHLLTEYGPTGFLVRVADKYHRLKSLLHDGKRPMVDESAVDTVRDLAGYCLLYLRWAERSGGDHDAE